MYCQYLKNDTLSAQNVKLAQNYTGLVLLKKILVK